VPTIPALSSPTTADSRGSVRSADDTADSRRRRPKGPSAPRARDRRQRAATRGNVEVTPSGQAHRAHGLPGGRLSPVRCHGQRAPRAGGALLSRQDELHAEVAVARRPIAPMLALVTLVLVTQVVGQTMRGAR
jgi:hypothetical protein